MKKFRIAVATAGAIGAVLVGTATPAAANEGVYVCVKYTYVYVAGRAVPTVHTVTVTMDPRECDFAFGL